MKRKVITPKIWIGVGYTYSATIPTSKGSTRLISATSVNSLLQEAAMPLYDKLADRQTPIRRLAIAFENVIDEGFEGYGNITPVERSFRRTGEYAHILQLVARNEEKLTETLTEAQKEIFEKFKDSMLEISSITEVAAFTLGFKLGLRLTAEAFIGGDSEQELISE